MRVTPIRGRSAPVLLCSACGLLCRPSALDGQGRCSRCESSRLGQYVSGTSRKPARTGLLRFRQRLGWW